MNTDTQEKVEVGTSRRSFLSTLWVVLGIVALIEMVWVVISFFRDRTPRGSQGAGETIMDTAAVGTFSRATVTAFPRGQFYLARLEDGGFLAISRTCTHLGCTVPWNEKAKQFECPCHSSVFDIAGNVLKAPAPRALDIFRVTIENDIVKVDTSRRIRRTEFRKDQVVYP
jgi:cytochrome b6-f complex iron-sulfur subunit